MNSRSYVKVVHLKRKINRKLSNKQHDIIKKIGRETPLYRKKIERVVKKQQNKINKIFNNIK